MVGETDLLGNPVASPAPRSEPRPTVNDMELIERVLREAASVGFVLVGIRELVCRRVTDDLVESVSPDVDHAVHQLIESKWLEVGGTHHVRYDRYTGRRGRCWCPGSRNKPRIAGARWQSRGKPPNRFLKAFLDADGEE